MDERASVLRSVESRKDSLIALSDSVWAFAETGLAEVRSSAALAAALEAEGFALRRGLAGIGTAFEASWGSGGPVIALLGEFDALPGLSQAAALPEKSELSPGGNGHGCGHNLLGVGSLGAALALKDYLAAAGLPGTVKYFGCPGEERGSGKTFMARSGAFDGVDFALTWHPSDVNCVMHVRTLANLSVYFRFRGKSAHAAGAPHLGRSALDAVELTNVGANYLREHIIPEARLHYAITDSGGAAPNVVQETAEVFYFCRAPRVAEARDIYDRLCDVARGAALMTGTSCEIRFGEGLSDYLPNRALGEVLERSMLEAGLPEFGEADRALASRFADTLSAAEKAQVLAQARLFQGPDVAARLALSPLAEVVGPLPSFEALLPGSTDVGDVSQIVPTGQVVTACAALGTGPHTWQFAAQAASSIGHEGMLAASRVLALAAIAALRDPAVVERAKAELLGRTGGKYVCPIPPEVLPGSGREGGA
jgi:aminobenzoyl-glutamate utilization protein B